MQIGVRGIDEDRDRRQLHDARRAAGLRFAEHRLLGDPIRLGIQAQRRGELDEAVGGPVLVLVKLGEKRVRLDDGGVELDGVPQVRLGGGGALAMNLGQREAYAQFVSVMHRGPDEQTLERCDGGVRVAAGERDLPGQKQRVGQIVGRRLRHGAGPFERPARLVGVTSLQRTEAARHPVARAAGLAGG